MTNKLKKFFIKNEKSIMLITFLILLSSLSFSSTAKVGAETTLGINKLEDYIAELFKLIKYIAYFGSGIFFGLKVAFEIFGGNPNWNEITKHIIMFVVAVVLIASINTIITKLGGSTIDYSYLVSFLNLKLVVA